VLVHPERTPSADEHTDHQMVLIPIALSFQPSGHSRAGSKPARMRSGASWTIDLHGQTPSSSLTFDIPLGQACHANHPVAYLSETMASSKIARLKTRIAFQHPCAVQPGHRRSPYEFVLEPRPVRTNCEANERARKSQVVVFQENRPIGRVREKVQDLLRFRAEESSAGLEFEFNLFGDLFCRAAIRQVAAGRNVS
jgi:hypothetical protein